MNEVIFSVVFTFLTSVQKVSKTVKQYRESSTKFDAPGSMMLHRHEDPHILIYLLSSASSEDQIYALTAFKHHLTFTYVSETPLLT